MIEELYIKNYALMDETRVSFGEKLNILTGETGAGKSVLIGALGLVLGGKADSSVIRTGCDEAEVTAVFQITQPRIRLWMEEHGLEPEEEKLIVRRKIRSSGRGAVYIQSRPFTLGELSELGQLLVDIHGQHDHQSLFHIDQHRRLLDRFGKLEPQASEVFELFQDLKALNSEIEALQAAREAAEKEKELLGFAIKEIEDAELREGEEEELEKSLQRMARAEQLFSLGDEALGLLAENRGGALGALRRGMNLLESLTALDEDIEPLKERFANAFYELEDIAQSLAGLNGDLNFSQADKEMAEDRMALLKKLERKYGSSHESIILTLQEKQEALALLEAGEDRLEELKEKGHSREERLAQKARELSDKRKIAALELEKCILGFLKELGMPSASFSVSVSRRTGEDGQSLCGAHGLDRVEFMFSANMGEPLKALKETASGGEISRVMLAIKSALAGNDRIPVLIFDEIDTGIGGEIAPALGLHMKRLASFHQILCVTHLASIAVYADNHIKVKKSESDGRTKTELFSLEKTEQVGEIARMLSGDSEGSASLSHAEEMFKGAVL